MYENLLTPEECDHIRKLALPQLQRSEVVPTEEGDSDIDPVRTSYGMFIRRNTDEVVARVEKRVAAWTHLPPINQEDMQVLRYGSGQSYLAHFDSLEGDSPRQATVLLYLSDGVEGGETAFPATTNEHWAHPSYAAKLGPFSECAEGHVAMKPRKGDALLFFSTEMDGKTEDPFSEHTGCPVLKGVKWTATVWVHPDPFQADYYGVKEDLSDPGLCLDMNKQCAAWAAEGACDTDEEYMWKGSGTCRRSCKKCRPCWGRSLRCYNANRRLAGYLELTSEEHALLYGG